MRLDGPARRLTVFVDEADQAPHSHTPLYCEIVRLAREAGLAGASVFHGIEGYGASRHVHVARILSLSPDLPVAVVIVDTPDRIDAFVHLVRELVTGGLITVDDLQAIGHRVRRNVDADEDAVGGHRDAALGKPPVHCCGRPAAVRRRPAVQLSPVPTIHPRPTAPNPPTRLAPT
jgi:PII-like signaling protein